MKVKLTPKQEFFCREYIISLNGLRSAIAAGYSEKTAGVIANENLNKPYIRDFIIELQAKRMEKLNIDADYVLKRLVDIDNLDVIDILNDDMSIKKVSEWPKVWRTLIATADLSTTKNDDDEITILNKIKWPDKMRNLELIGKHINVRAWEKESVVKVSNHIMPVPTADSVDGWEEVAKQQQEDLLGRDD